jgi:hypothetical protein
MTIWWLVVILATIGSAGIAFIWLALRVGGINDAGQPAGRGRTLSESYEAAAREDVEHLFNEEFREELRNRGRLNFEKVINENAMFLQQDLRLTTSQINEYMKSEITAKLKEEFSKYEQSIIDATQIAVESIQKTNLAVDEQRKLLSQQVQQEILAEKQETIRRFESNMADIVNHYVLAAIGDQIDLNDQLEYILGEMEANKKAIIEDIHGGA